MSASALLNRPAQPLPGASLCPRLWISSLQKETSLCTKPHIKTTHCCCNIQPILQFSVLSTRFYCYVYFLIPFSLVPHYIDLCVRPATLCPCSVLRVSRPVASSAARHSLNFGITATRSVAAARPLDIPFISSPGPLLRVCMCVLFFFLHDIFVRL